MSHLGYKPMQGCLFWLSLLQNKPNTLFSSLNRLMASSDGHLYLYLWLSLSLSLPLPFFRLLIAEKYPEEGLYWLMFNTNILEPEA